MAKKQRQALRALAARQSQGPMIGAAPAPDSPTEGWDVYHKVDDGWTKEDTAQSPVERGFVRPPRWDEK